MNEWLTLAEQDLNEYTVTPGVLGFIVFAVLGVGVWILLKSLSRHLGRIDFQEAAEEAEAPGAAPGERAGSSA
jgi:hypothetical protein